MADQHAVVVCTIARPDDVRKAVTSVLDQTLQPDLVVVVDASQDPAIAESLAQVDLMRRPPTRLLRASSPPGLPLQRNHGFSLAIDVLGERDLFVHFVDDDVELEPDYLEQISAVFHQYPDAVVVGGRDVERTPRKHSLIGRIILTDSKREGTILRSGFNIMCETPRVVTQVEWVSGLSQSYRVSALGSIRFDESIRFYGEEVDMHVRCSEIGGIYWTPFAKLHHASSQVGRERVRTTTAETDAFKWRLCGQHPRRFHRGVFLYSTFFHMVLKLVSGVTRRQRADVETAQGHWDMLSSLVRASVRSVLSPESG